MFNKSLKTEELLNHYTTNNEILKTEDCSNSKIQRDCLF